MLHRGRAVALFWRRTPLRRRRRRVELLLPRLHQRPRAAAMIAPLSMYVPRKLAELGIGGYEPEALACFLAAIDAAPPGAVWDVGANVGIYGLVARAACDREVVAFEPTPTLARVARNGGEGSGLPYRVEELALSDYTGSATFYLSDQTDSSNSLQEGFRASTEQLTVPVDTIDNLVAGGELGTPAVLKIDTEATEPAVIRGGLELIRAHRPWILCEVLAGRTPDALMAVLDGLGYSWYHITDQVPYPRQEQIYGDDTYRHLMWLFAPEPVTEAFFERVRLWSAELRRCVARAGTR